VSGGDTTHNLHQKHERKRKGRADPSSIDREKKTWRGNHPEVRETKEKERSRSV